MNRCSSKFVLLVALTVVLASGVSAQVINPTPFFTSFADTTMSSTYNGQPLPIGSIVQAYDPSGTYCGIDTVVLDGGSGNPKFGYFSVYGDDANTTGVDEGASAGEQITFKINGRTAAVDAGDDTFSDQSLKSVTLSASATVALSLHNQPFNKAVAPGRTEQFQVDVRNDGNGLDFYGVKLSMSLPGGTGAFDWEALEPDSVIYADSGATVPVFFSVRTPTFHSDTVNTISYTVFSHVDTAVTGSGSFDVYMTVTDVDDPDINLPGSFVLHQNYPNPFNPTTTILFNLSARSAAQLDIFDITGRTVESRKLGVLPSGDHTVEFDASGLASGVYFYRLATENAVDTRKMMLLK
ncbi:MAG: T9SS type A sorting domain-containing protein [bacterium]|nr:T9SS type A sorting domain-containing protein [bacterium]